MRLDLPTHAMIAETGRVSPGGYGLWPAVDGQLLAASAIVVVMRNLAERR